LQIQPWSRSPGIHDGTRESVCKKKGDPWSP
jgi:hypothetical protein